MNKAFQRTVEEPGKEQNYELITDENSLLRVIEQVD